MKDHRTRTLFLSPWSPLLALGVAAFLALGASPDPGPGAEPAADGRVIVLGFDGASGESIENLLAAYPDDYPTFRKLAAEGTFSRLTVEAPPESPVSWAALNTGQNPAKTGVPGFVRRDFLGGNPTPALGHIIPDDVLLLESAENTPIPVWSKNVTAAIAGGAVFLVVFLVLMIVLRGRFAIAAVVALLFGGAGAWAGATARGYLAESYPRTSNVNQARNFWDFAAEGGKRVLVIDAAQAFDMPAPDGAKVLAGLGLPDARNAIGDWFIYTTDPLEVARPPSGRSTTTAGTVYRVDPDFEGMVQTKLYGPQNFWLEQKLEAELKAMKAELADPTISLERSMELSTLQRTKDEELKAAKREGTSVDLVVTPQNGKALVELDGVGQELGVGEWSDFYELTFELNPLLKVHALTRVKLVSLDDPHLELFVNVLDIDPRKPPFWQNVSTPPEFAAELAHVCGPYETYGWSTATMPFKDGEISAASLMEEVEFTLSWRRNVVKAALERDDWDCLMAVFSTTDRVQHMMYQFYDEGHPLYDETAANETMEFFGKTIRMKDAIPEIYRQMDRVIGEILAEYVGPNDTLLVCSDHGFQSARYQVDLNNWLHENGYLFLKPGAGKKTSKALFFVDWKKTKVYSLGMGFLYLNLEGREPNGIVKPGEADALLKEVREKLLQATDPANGTRFCPEVYVTKEIHSGPHLSLESDMIVGFAPHYRIGWNATSGGFGFVKDNMGIDVPGPVISDNDSPWSGGHVSMALPAVAGAFFSNRKVDPAQGDVKLLQIAPTALDLLGVPVPSVMDVGPIRFR